MKVKLVTARLRDLSELLAMVADFNREEAIRNSPQRIRAAIRKLMMDRSLGRVFLIRVGVGIAGYTILGFGYDHEYGGREGWITDVFVSPAFRQQGIASAALKLLEHKAKAAGVNVLHLMVRKDNRRAQRVYTRCGFKTNPRMAMIKLL